MFHVRKVIYFWFSLIAFVEEVSTFKYLTRVKARRPRFRSFTPRLRVLQGRSDVNDIYPFVVALLDENPHDGFRSCTGSLITQRWVLTAGHCINDEISFIRCGNMNVSWPESNCKSKVLRMFNFPSFINVSREQHDIALVLTEGVEIRKYGRIHAADYKTFLGRSARFAGFGATYPSYSHSRIGEKEAVEEDNKRELQIGEGVIFNPEDKSYEGDLPRIGMAPKCSNIRETPYFGDSGGPLLVDGKIVGVLASRELDHRESITFINAKHPEHNYYTPVSPYLEWIKHMIIKNTF